MAAFRVRVEAVLHDFLDGRARAAAADGMPAVVVETVRAFFAAGGKRLRPLVCVAGWYAASGRGDTASLVRAAAALEMLHAFALVHDDVMDDSATRRGRPTVHRALTTRHDGGRTAAAAARIGAGAAILIGDLALSWSDELLRTAGLTDRQLRTLWPLIGEMREEVMYGQYLDLTSTGRPSADVEQAMRTVRYKTAKYTLERPLHIGAVLAGAGPRLLDELSAFALPIGEAFQLRDDLLNVYGDPSLTGKPCLDDLREGKHTVLVACALRNADPEQQAALRTLLGTPDLTAGQAGRLRRLLSETGARRQVEDLNHHPPGERRAGTCPQLPCARRGRRPAQPRRLRHPPRHLTTSRTAPCRCPPRDERQMSPCHARTCSYAPSLTRSARIPRRPASTPWNG
ncbi:polyprenyl synthetase family protein [Streptomyces sp. NPDC001594]|uniref:polyprenyl synthetase family protein n=1 Tax=Streptomyces sp. NPDC001594 TaxID=3364590 RepID=UPI00369924BE